MATKTTNYGLEKPDGTDFYDVDVQNSNMDIIDKQMKANANAITQLNSELYGLHLHLLHLSGTTDEYGQLWVGDTGINLSDVKFIDCVSNTFTRPTNPYGIVNLEGIEGDSLKFRLVATNNTVFGNYHIDKYVALVYKC